MTSLIYNFGLGHYEQRLSQKKNPKNYQKIDKNQVHQAIRIVITLGKCDLVISCQFRDKLKSTKLKI